MAEPHTVKDVVALPVHDTTSPEFERLARRLDVPRAEGATDLVFTPAFGRFAIGNGPIVDISHLHIPPSADPLGEARHRPVIDRHLDSEEVWVVTKGDLVMGMALSEDGEDVVPSVRDFRLFLLREGEMIVLPAGRWHGGIWGARPNEPAEFLMFLSGHRADDDGGLVDHVMESYPEDVSVVPSLASA
jgi:mannose-6-phosphate isomerase-like protein (cupin superfamily)